jgi:hypothetical protein
MGRRKRWARLKRNIIWIMRRTSVPSSRPKLRKAPQADV